MKVFWWEWDEKKYHEVTGNVDITACAGISFIIMRNPLHPKHWAVFEFTTGCFVKGEFKTRNAARAFAEEKAGIVIELMKRYDFPDINSPAPADNEVQS